MAVDVGEAFTVAVGVMPRVGVDVGVVPCVAVEVGVVVEVEVLAGLLTPVVVAAICCELIACTDDGANIMIPLPISKSRAQQSAIMLTIRGAIPGGLACTLI